MNRGAPFRWVLLGIVLTAFVTTVVIEMLSHRGAEGERDAALTSANEPMLSQRLADLETELRGLRDQLEHAASRSAVDAIGTASHAPQPLSAISNEDLSAQLRDMQAALVALGERLDAGLAGREEALSTEVKAAIADALQSAGPRAEPMPDTMTDAPPQVARLQAVQALGSAEASSRHLLWTYDRVAQEYGRPTAVTPTSNGAIQYRYELANGDQILFWFVSGKVVKVFW